VHEALGGAFPKRHQIDCGMITIICKVPILGRHTSKQAERINDAMNGTNVHAKEDKNDVTEPRISDQASAKHYKS
jgi:hypothetical protein